MEQGDDEHCCLELLKGEQLYCVRAPFYKHRDFILQAILRRYVSR